MTHDEGGDPACWIHLFDDGDDPDDGYCSRGLGALARLRAAADGEIDRLAGR
ncbi:MAG: hypothetical protein RIE08_01930 [Acidimicrobiales bacterium]